MKSTGYKLQGANNSFLKKSTSLEVLYGLLSFPNGYKQIFLRITFWFGIMMTTGSPNQISLTYFYDHLSGL